MTPIVVWLLACAWLGPDDLDAFEDQDGDQLPFGIDCDDADPNVLTGYPLFVDADGDGHGDPNHPTQACQVEPGTALNADDCDDADPTAHSGATERCGGGDEDCDGAADDLDPEGVLDAARWYVDADQDGYGAGEGIASCVAQAGRVALGTDCNDADDAIHPGADEFCDSVDADCDFRVGDADPDTKGRTPWYLDADGDGFGDDATSKDLCVAPPLYVALGTDCDDADAAVSPAAQEQCGGGDEDCDGKIDDDDPNTFGGTTWYADADADGFGDLLAPSVGCFPTGRVADMTDCDDARANVNPDAQEVCDAVNRDEDCDGAVDDVDSDATGQLRYYVDGDDDNHGSPDAIEYWCDPPPDVAAAGDDCDDLRSHVFPGAVDVPYDGLDQDCDYWSDDDADRDGHDDKGHGGDDCDDTKASTYPGAVEVWYDGVDDDCDGKSDLDQDKDGYDSDKYGGKDCDDKDSKFNPGVAEVWYDGVDQDCAGDDDYDQDHDAHRVLGQGDDCDDEEATTYPNADEFVDTIDSDCDGKDYVCGDTIRRVPRDLATPQLAIAASCAGDTVRVDPGDWPGPFPINQNITVEGMGARVRFVGDGTKRVVTMGRATLRNLTITGGYTPSHPGGGGLKIENGTGARLEGVTISGNTSGSWGGGITIYNSGFVRLTNVTVESNTGGSGGGLMLAGCPDARIEASTIRDNVSTGSGGGLFTFDAHRLVVTDSTFEGNTGGDGGGAYFSSGDGMQVLRSRFVGNDANGSGGFHVSRSTNLLLQDLEVSDNVVVGSGGGGAGFTYNDDCTLDGFEVRGNVAGQYGGLTFYQSTCTVRHAHIWENDGIGLNAGYTPLGFVLEDSQLDANLGGGLTNTFGTLGTYSNLTLRGNTVFGVRDDATSTFTDIEIRDTVSTGYYAGFSASNAVIRGLTVYGASGTGVRLGGNLDVEGLVSAGNLVGVDVSGLTGRMTHATVVGNGSDGLQLDGPSTVQYTQIVSAYNLVGLNGPSNGGTFESCLVANNGSSNAYNGISIAACSTANPKFQTLGPGLDPNLIDVHVRPGSPLKDVGALGGDADGTREDIGAYGGLLDPLDAAEWYTDLDNDTLPDGWERDHGLDVTKDDRATDLDADGLTNLVEYTKGTLPDRTDTDNDNLADKTELDSGTDPASPYSP